MAAAAERADYEGRSAWEFVFYNQAANAEQIAESIDEPALFIAKIIKAINGKGNVFDRYDAIESLISDAARQCANEQAEAAHNHVMNTPGGN